MRTPMTWPIEALVPHAETMCLLHRAIAGDALSIVCEVDVQPDNLFCHDDGVGGWVGIEYMAQTVAAWAGWQARQRDEEPRIGFLLGTRRYSCSRPRFVVGQILRIEATQLFGSPDGLGQFDCRIFIGDEEVASAALTVFEPSDAAKFLKGEGHE